MFDIADEALASVGASSEQDGSNFHLNDPDLLKTKLKAAGFSRALHYFFSVPLNHPTPTEALQDRIGDFPGVREILQSSNVEKAAKLRSAIQNRLERRMIERHQALTFEALVVVAFK
jgi:hypothetical protein